MNVAVKEFKTTMMTVGANTGDAIIQIFQQVKKLQAEIQEVKKTTASMSFRGGGGGHRGKRGDKTRVVCIGCVILSCIGPEESRHVNKVPLK